MGNFYHWVGTCDHRKFCSEFFSLTFFWAFSCIFQAPLSWSLWFGHHWKYLFLLLKLNIDDASFGRRAWCQKWNKCQGSSWLVTIGMGVYRLIRYENIELKNFSHLCHLLLKLSFILITYCNIYIYILMLQGGKLIINNNNLLVVVQKRQGGTLKRTKCMKTNHLMPYLVKVKEIILVR